MKHLLSRYSSLNLAGTAVPAPPRPSIEPVIGTVPESPMHADSNVLNVPVGSKPRITSVGQLMQRQIPILIPAFNNPTYVRNMVRQLRARNLTKLIVVDNASTSDDMRALLDSEFGAIAVRLDRNEGPRHVFLNDESFYSLPELFVVTDPDLELNPQLPPDFLAQLVTLTERFKVGKAGFSLEISDLASMRNDQFYMDRHDVKRSIIGWERQFWDHPIGELGRFGTIYHAGIDTTFAVYNKKYLDRENHHDNSVRVAGVFTCRHLPWYHDTGVSAREAEIYSKTSRWSHYIEQPELRGRRGNNVLVIVPTRSRPANCIGFADAFFAHSTRSDLLFALDEDDPELTSYAGMPGVQYELNPRLRLVGTLNLVANKYADQYAYLVFMGDDHRIHTPGWDQLLVEAVADLPAGIAYGDDLQLGAELPTAVLLKTDIVRTLGFMAPPELIHRYKEQFWRDLGQALGSLRYRADVVIEHLHVSTGKAADDVVYQEANSADAIARDHAAYERYTRTRLRIDIARLKGLSSQGSLLDEVGARQDGHLQSDVPGFFDLAKDVRARSIIREVGEAGQ